MRIVYEEDDIAIVTTNSGKRFVAVYTLAPGIDYFWHPVLQETKVNYLVDNIVDVEVIGTKNV